MSNDQILVFVICYSIACILIYKYYLYNQKRKNMKLITGICTDTSLHTGYRKNTYLYYYSYTIDNEEYNASDKTRFKNPFFNPKIKDEVKLYIDSKNPAKHITPLEIFYGNAYLYISIVLLILPLLFRI